MYLFSFPVLPRFCCFFFLLRTTSELLLEQPVCLVRLGFVLFMNYSANTMKHRYHSIVLFCFFISLLYVQILLRHQICLNLNVDTNCRSLQVQILNTSQGVAKSVE